MLFLYRVFLRAAFPVILLRLLWRAVRDRRYLEKFPQRFGFCIRDEKTRGGIWVHAVSVGEVNAAAPLLRHLLEKHPRRALTVSTMTPTGADRLRQTFGARVRHCYLPYDYPGAARRFVRAVSPQLALVMETELWPNLIAACARAGVPMMYVNARMSARSHRGYQKVRGLIRPALRCIERFAVQTGPDARRLIRLGAHSSALTLTGSIKFDQPPAPVDAARAMRRAFGARPVWAAGSTHDGEEAQLLDAFATMRGACEPLLLALAPRHPQRFGAVRRFCMRRGYEVALRSRGDAVTARTDIYLADTMGELPALLAASDVAFIGGSLTAVGGHNLLEAAAAGVPVVFGMHMHNFTEIANLVLRHAAGIQVADAEELAEVVLRLLGDPALRAQYGARGKELVEQNRGALAKICAMVDEMLRR